MILQILVSICWFDLVLLMAVCFVVVTCCCCCWFAFASFTCIDFGELF